MFCHFLGILQNFFHWKFMIFAIGSLMNTQAPTYNINASKYYHLPHAVLFQSSHLESPTISVVQALFLMTFYLCLSN
ncbi:hypothetical protein J3A83DRAFT_4373247 [Scleroderma citrinum]